MRRAYNFDDRAFAKEMSLLAVKVRGKGRWKGSTRAERSLHATLMVRARLGRLPYTPDQLEAWREGYKAGFEIAAGRK